MAKRNSNGLTEKWQIVLDAWLADPERVGSRAYKKGYPQASLRTCETQFSELLRKPEINAYLLKMTEAAAEKACIDAALVLTRLGEMVDADPLDIFDEKTGAYKHIKDWPLVWRRMLSAADVQKISADGNEIGEIVKFKFIDRLKAYELIGKHIDVSAFKEKIEHSGGFNLSNLSDDQLKDIINGSKA